MVDHIGFDFDSKHSQVLVRLVSSDVSASITVRKSCFHVYRSHDFQLGAARHDDSRSITWNKIITRDGGIVL